MKRAVGFIPLFAFVALLCGLAAFLLKGKDPTVLLSPMIGRSAGLLPPGEPYLVNFFASWCVSCAAEQDVLAALAKEKKLNLIGIAYKDKPKDTAAWLKKHGNPFREVISDDQGKKAIDWGITGVPETFAVDAQGIVRYRHPGPVTAEDVENLLEALKP